MTVMPIEPLTIGQPSIQNPEEWQVEDKTEYIKIPESKFLALSVYETRVGSLIALRDDLLFALRNMKTPDSNIFISAEEIIDRIQAILGTGLVDEWMRESWRDWQIIEDSE